MMQSIQFGSKEISFQLEYAERKSLGISVSPDTRVLVKAPEDATLEKIKAGVKRKAPWILKQQSFFQTFLPKAPERKFVSGESHLYLGRQYRLSVSEGNKNEVRYKGRFIEVVIKSKKNTRVLMEEWYRHKAKEKFAEIAEPLIKKFTRYEIEPKGIYIQEMKKRWGSCTPSGRILLNPELIKAPKECIEYVIVHELCHLVHYNHTGKFYGLLKRMMPDWEKRKGKLERMLG